MIPEEVGLTFPFLEVQGFEYVRTQVDNNRLMATSCMHIAN